MSRNVERMAARKNLAEKIAALRQKRGRYGAMLADLERTGENQISLIDPDSRAMAGRAIRGAFSAGITFVDAPAITIGDSLDQNP